MQNLEVTVSYSCWRNRLCMDWCDELHEKDSLCRFNRRWCSVKTGCQLLFLGLWFHNSIGILHYKSSCICFLCIFFVFFNIMLFLATACNTWHDATIASYFHTETITHLIFSQCENNSLWRFITFITFSAVNYQVLCIQEMCYRHRIIDKCYFHGYFLYFSREKMGVTVEFLKRGYLKLWKRVKIEELKFFIFLTKVNISIILIMIII